MGTSSIGAWWGSDAAQSAADLTEAEADLLLRRLHSKSERPMLVDVVDGADDVLTIGVGRELSVLTFMRGSGDPPYLTSSGDGTPSAETLWFDYDGAETEFDATSLIPLDLALLVVADFLGGAGLARVSWREE